MTYEEFLVKLKETPRDWYLLSSGRIRRTSKSGSDSCMGSHAQCPISSLRDTWVGFYESVAKQLELSDTLTRRIVLAADTYNQSKTRLDLLEACGLVKEAA